MAGFTREQIEQLLRAINPLRVGTDGKGHSHVEAYEIRAHLTRIFGFGNWDDDVTRLDFVYETSEEKVSKKGEPYTAWTVCYRATMRVEVRSEDGLAVCHFEDGATGAATNQPSRDDAHDLALKSALSGAFKRAVVNLGDQFGLGLYAKGSRAALVKKTLVMPDADSGNVSAPVDEHITAPLPAESVEAEDRRETNPATPPPAPQGPPPPSPELEKWRKTLLTGPDKDEHVAPFYARLMTAMLKGKFQGALIEDRKGEMRQAQVVLQDEQKRAQQERAA